MSRQPDTRSTRMFLITSVLLTKLLLPAEIASRGVYATMVRYGLTRLRDRLVSSDSLTRTGKEPTESVREIESPASPGAEQPLNKPSAPAPAAQVDPRAFRDGYEPKASDVFIAVMGVTGAGKSTFISKCTEKEVRIGHNLQACEDAQR